MPELSRRRDHDARLETWTICYGDVDVGTIARLELDPVRPANVWRWSCGIYPGAHPRENKAGIARTFEAARAAWQTAWEQFLPLRRPEDFEEWRRYKRYMADKIAGKLPPRKPATVIRCPCGAEFDSHVPAENQIHSPHINLAKRARLGGW
jgi:hypothetical protein